MAVAVVLALAVTLFVSRRRTPNVAVQGVPPSPVVAAAAHAAKVIAILCAIAGAGANACMLRSVHLCTATGTLPLPLPVRAAGIVLAYLGLAGFVLAASAITAADSNTLVRAGPYGVCRHPQLACGAAIGVGVVLATRSGLAVPGVAALWLMGAATALVEEERHLALAFGAKWDAYVQTTPALVPRLFGAAPQPGSPAMHAMKDGAATFAPGPARMVL
jgi:protein-S-isoprenylcysteine O-methyltransferase Ste14